MVPRSGESPFDGIKRTTPDGEYWSARELQPLMGYARWNDFQRALERAVAAAANTGQHVEELFRRCPEKTGGRPRMDFHLTRAAAYLLALNGDPNKPEVAAAQAYFVIRTREAETQAASTEAATPRAELTSAAGPLPYRDQAEILAILRPVLPEHYATATGKVILARAMGERPELESGETPLYASTFLAEKGHKPATVAKFQSGFGSRVSNRYLKMHGRRPEKIPGPAGSRIDKVVVYSEDDRPLLEEVYAEVAEAIMVFEGDGQLPLDASRAA
ncbi:BRO family protein [Streptomyces lydicus]|uniref:BRO family protein n=1 Tax=Streptomyces lydicus TaxID=47763 RepID=UPI0036E5C01A